MSYYISDLLTKTLGEIGQEFARIDSHESALDFFDNELNRLARGKLGAILALIPNNISHLSLARTNLNLCTVSHLVTDLAFIPAHIKFLDLGGNKLFSKSVKGLKRIFRALPETLHTLGLDSNTISTNTANPETLHTLGLDSNTISTNTANDVIRIFSAINKGVVRLKMGYNSLAYNLNDLIRLVANIPFHITSFDISNNNLDRITTSNLVAVFTSLSDQVEEFTLSAEDFQCRSNGDLAKLGTALPYVAKLHVLDGHDNPVSNLSAVAVLKSHIGSGLIKQYKEIQALDNLPWELRRLVLEYSNVSVANLEGLLEGQNPLYALHTAAWRNYLASTALGGFVLATAPLWWPYVPVDLAISTLPFATSTLCTGGFGLFTSPVSSVKKPEPNNERRLVIGRSCSPY